MNIRCLCMVLWMGGCTAPEMSRAFTQVDMTAVSYTHLTLPTNREV